MDYRQAQNTYKMPYDIPSTSGDLATPQNASNLSNNGTFSPTNLLPGENPNIPSTYPVPTQGTGQAPYNTIDVTATPVNSAGSITGAANGGSLPGTNTAGSLPQGSTLSPTATEILPGVNGENLTPTVGNGLPGSSSAVSAAESGAESWAQGALGGSLGRAVEELAPVLDGLKALGPLGYLPDVLDFLKGQDIADEAGKLAAAQSAEMTAAQTKQNLRRKGNKIPNPNKPIPQPATRGIPGKTYTVTIANAVDNRFSNSSSPPGVYQAVAPFSLSTIDSGGAEITYLVDANSRREVGRWYDAYGGTNPIILDAVANDGTPDPYIPPTPMPFRTPSGLLYRQGTMPDPTNQPSPSIPPIPSPPQQHAPNSTITPGQPPTQQKDTPPSAVPVPVPVPIPGNPPGQTPTPVPSLPSAPTTMPPGIPGPSSSPNATAPKAPTTTEIPGEKVTPEPDPEPPIIPPADPCQASPCQLSQKQAIQDNGNQLAKLNALLSGLDLGALLAGLAEIKNLITTVQTTINGLIGWLQLDRLLNILTFITTLHNAYMLSSALTQTLFSAIDGALGLLGIHMQDASGKAISINQLFNNSVEGLGRSIFGIDTWDGIKTEWAALNRIYQAATNLLYAMQALFYSVLAGMEVIGQYTASIGNALKKWRVIGHNAFGWMNIQPNFHNSLFTNINSALMTVSQINFVIQTISGVKSIIEQMTKQGEDLQKDLKEAVPTSTFTSNDPISAAETASQAASPTPDVSLDDLNADLW